MADGVFTPAVSVTSAVGGIAVAKPSVSRDIIPISIVRLTIVCCIYAKRAAGVSRGIVLGSAIWDDQNIIHVFAGYDMSSM